VNRWERFSDTVSQGSWSDAMMICQFRSRMPTAIRNRFTHLPKSTRHDWKQMSRRFRKLYIVKPLSPPDGDPVRDGPKPHEMCVLVCKGPERRTQRKDNQQCMHLVQNEVIYSKQLYSEYQRSDDPIAEIPEPESQDPLEVPLKPGQRYGWWKVHEHGDMHGLATIHGAMNDSRTRILLDTGASVSIMSLDLARRLKLKLRTHRQIKVSGLGVVTTYITTYARVKITLGRSVVYVLNIWVGNIGESVDVLLGLDFSHSAGVRLCI
ncbi:hypothetical protein PHMEG_00010348, partial [Phytophthora megakarya]